MSAQAEDRSLLDGAVRVEDLERLTFTPSGLVHWLVSDVVAGLAAQNGLRVESDWLLGLPEPVKRASPFGIMAVLTRIRDETTAASLRAWDAVNEIERVDLASVLSGRPPWLGACVNGARESGLWAGAVREAHMIVQAAWEEAALRDRRDVLSGCPVDEAHGWRATFMEWVEMDLWGYAREVTFASFGTEDDFGICLGGDQRWWPGDGTQEQVRVLRVR